MKTKSKEKEYSKTFYFHCCFKKWYKNNVLKSKNNIKIIFFLFDEKLTKIKFTTFFITIFIFILFLNTSLYEKYPSSFCVFVKLYFIVFYTIIIELFIYPFKHFFFLLHPSHHLKKQNFFTTNFPK